MATKNTLKFFALLFLAASIALLISGFVFLDQSKKASMPQEREEKKSKSNKMFIAFGGMLVGCFIFFGLANSDSQAPENLRSYLQGTGSRVIQSAKSAGSNLRGKLYSVGRPTPQSLEGEPGRSISQEIKNVKTEEERDGKTVIIYKADERCKNGVYGSDDDKTFEIQIYDTKELNLKPLITSQKGLLSGLFSTDTAFETGKNMFRIHKENTCTKPSFGYTTGITDEYGVHIPILVSSQGPKSLWRYVPRKSVVGKASEEGLDLNDKTPANYIRFYNELDDATLKKIREEYGSTQAL